VPSVLRCARHSMRGKPSCPGRWTPRGLRLRLRSCCARLNRVSRACGLGRRGYAPRLAAGPWADLWSAGAASANRLPPPSIDRAGARCDSGGSGQLCPCPTPGRRLGVAPCVARLTPIDCAPMACQRSWHGLFAARARCRGGVAATTGFGAGEAFRHLSSSPTHGDRDPGRPAPQGLRHFVRSFTRSLRAAASAAPWHSGLAAGVDGSPRATNSGNTAVDGKRSPQRQAGKAKRGGSESWNPVS